MAIPEVLTQPPRCQSHQGLGSRAAVETSMQEPEREEQNISHVVHQRNLEAVEELLTKSESRYTYFFLAPPSCEGHCHSSSGLA